MIENITEYKLELMKEYLKYSIKKSRTTTFVCSGIIILCSLLEFLFKEYIMAGVFLAVGLFFLAIAFIMLPISMKKVTAMPDIKNEYKFFPDKLVVETFSKDKSLGTSTIPYNAIFKVAENNNVLYIYLNKVQALVVNTDNFKESTDKEVVKAYISNFKEILNNTQNKTAK